MSIRHIAISNSQKEIVNLEEIHAVYFENSYEAQTVHKEVKEEDEAFWNIAQ